MRPGVASSDTAEALPRSVLFVPAHRTPLIDKAAAGEADAVCLDLEDGVPAGSRRAARAGLASACAKLRAAGKPVWVRINPEIDQVSHDIDALPLACDVVVLPKVEALLDVQRLESALRRRFAHGALAIVALVETAAGACALHDARGAPPAMLLAIALGTEDLAADLGCEPDAPPVLHAFDALALDCARLRVALFGSPAPIGFYRALERFESGVQRGVASGSLGGFCIHPAQLPVLHAAYRPSDSELASARSIVTAYERACVDGQISAGAIAVEGRMVDAPVYRRALRLVTRARAVMASSTASARC